MAGLSRPFIWGLAFFTAYTHVAASPLLDKSEIVKHLLGRDNFEWTSLGDSYSSGVGAGDYVLGSYRCLRYNQAYPVMINSDSRLPNGNHLFHNAVCSGSKTEDVEAYQFLEKDTSGIPSRQYGDRPRFGSPSLSTLSVGGNDIDFPGIIFNCILEIQLPNFIQPFKTCDEQRKITWDLLIDPGLADKIDHTIKTAVDKGRKGPIGDKFKLYVTGFPQFFSVETDECDKVTFARKANPVDDGKQHTRLTQELRKEFNAMSIQLNKAIADAVSRNTDRGVRWIPIDDAMAGHRFCERGVKEPDQRNPNLWLYHYPYNEPKDDALDGPLLAAYQTVNAKPNGASQYSSYIDYQNALLDNVQLPGNSTQQDLLDQFWSGLGNRVKVFHPQLPLHQKIRDMVLDAYIADLKANTPKIDPTPAPKDENKCHGVGGDYWVMSRDVAVDNAKAFCGQKSKEVIYNKDSVNELSLAVRNLKDDSKGPSEAPDCVGRFARAVIDGCDGDDHVNNPHNYKFGSTLTTGDGWEYKMTPLSKQVNEVRCDVSYKFFWDSIEIRGKNLPDARFGANGEGLHDNLNGCGSVTDWKFERTPDDVKFQWYAYCRLPIGTKACVGRALQSAGGANDGGCSGAGKRWTGESYGIEDWPGYGDDSKHVFKHPTAVRRDNIDDWPGYGDDSKHVFKHDAN